MSLLFHHHHHHFPAHHFDCCWDSPWTIDLCDPFDDLDFKIRHDLFWIHRPCFYDTVIFPLIPEKYRVTVDCSDFSPSSIKTDIKGTKITVTAREEDRSSNDDYVVKELKKTYELPEEAETDKIASFVNKEGKLIIEAPLKRDPEGFDLDEFLFPKVSDDGKSISFNFRLPEKIEQSKIRYDVYFFNRLESFFFII